MYHGNNDYAGEYAKKRLGSSHDDRCNNDKKTSDAELRGRIGINRANDIIKAIDDIKSRR